MAETVDYRAFPVLVVDDEPDILTSFRVAFRDEFDVACAGSGEEGLRMLNVTVPDLVITDSHLPGMQGAQVLQHIRNEPALRHLPVIIASGDAFTEARESLLRLGASDYLVKPFLYTDLQALLEKHLPARKPQPA